MMKKLYIVFLVFNSFTYFNVANADSWPYGQITRTESYTDEVVLYWKGSHINDGEGCSQMNKVSFKEVNLGSEPAMERAFSIILTAQSTDKPIQLHIEGCEGSKQKATAIQLCKNDDCSTN